MSSMFHTPRTAQRHALALQQQQMADIKRAEEKRFSEEEQKKIAGARRRAKGRGGTILTSGMGVLGAAPIERKRLLGE